MFIKVGTVKDIQPGQIKAFEIEGKRIAIANLKGQFFAIDDTCTHEECSLAGGQLEGEAVVCPCHGSKFEVKSGWAMTLPAVSSVATYKVRKEGEDLLVEV